jgi:hypothetical protein
MSSPPSNEPNITRWERLVVVVRVKGRVFVSVAMHVQLNTTTKAARRKPRFCTSQIPVIGAGQ